MWGDDNNTTYSVATPSADGLMSKTDKTQLDKTVGVNMTSTAPYIAVSVNTKYLRLMNVDYAGGASLYLHGAERETDPGIFTLTAHNGTTSKKLIGKPDGTLTWNGTNVMYVHPTTAGNKHIPSGGSSGQILKYSAAGTAAWSSLSDANIFPKPTTASGVGQLYQCGTSTAKEFTLPSGGTWFYVMECFNPNSTSIGTKVGTAAGGAKVTALNTTDTRSHCWAIRIA